MVEEDDARGDDAEPRRCALPDCAVPLPTGSSSRRLYCCDAHKSLASYRRRSERVAELRQMLGALHGAGVCPFDGRVFAAGPMFARRRGRPRKYDCPGCRELARQQRLHAAGK